MRTRFREEGDRSDDKGHRELNAKMGSLGQSPHEWGKTYITLEF
jgi:hypothetical protein